MDGITMADDVTPATPRHLHRSAHPNRRRTDRWWVKIVLALIVAAGTVASGYYSGLAAIGDRERGLLERIVKLETQRESENKAIMARLDELKEQVTEQRRDARADVNGIRDEIMRMLRELRR